MANLKPNEIRLNKINHELKVKGSYYKYDVQKVKAYLKTLLLKCLEALAEEDYTKYNLAESVLNENIVRIGTNIENFEEFYSALKNEVAIDFLKTLLGVENISVLAANNPVEAVIITPEKAKLIKESWDFMHYAATKKTLYNYYDSEDYFKIFENEAYNVLVNPVIVVIVDKRNISGTYLDTNYSFKYGLEFDVLEAFVTNRPELITPLTLTERILLAENEADYSSEMAFNYITDSLENNTVLYYNENEAFIVVINDSLYKIINKITGKAFILYVYHYQKDLKKTIKFLADFSDYCLGVEGTLKDFEIIEEEVVLVDPTEEPIENDVEENVPTEEEGVLENG